MLHELIHTNYATILIVVFMITFLLTNASFERRIIRLFMGAILIALGLVIVDSIETYTASFPEPSNLRILVSAIGYTLRPACILFILLIILRRKKVKQLLWIPLVLNGIISFSAFFGDWAFSYSDTNEFVRGPLGISAYVTSGFYVLLLFGATIRFIREKSYYDGLIVFAIILNCGLSIYLEAVHEFYGFINVSIAISVCFYYMYYHVQNFKLDPLTQSLNRHYYEIDVVRNQEDIKAIVNIDLNDLKVINDTKGHKYGDIALAAIALCMKDHLPRRCKLYRVGGDEFCILCFRDNMEKSLQKMMTDIKKDLEKSNYSCAMGLAVLKDGESFEEMLKRADAVMYKNKAHMKAQKRGENCLK